jgi:hypothetical protein
MTRLISAWRTLTPEQRLAGGAAGALFVTMFLPWYQQNAVVNAPRAAPLQSRNLNAFQVFSFIEAAVLLVAVAVLYLLFARGERRSFQLPGGDGVVVFAAGIWIALLLVLRLFDKPGISSHGVAANVGIQWGIFFALAAAGLPHRSCTPHPAYRHRPPRRPAARRVEHSPPRRRSSCHSRTPRPSPSTRLAPISAGAPTAPIIARTMPAPSPTVPASVADVAAGLRAVGYLPGESTALVAFLAAKLGKPVLVEGPAGVGKTELAK